MPFCTVTPFSSSNANLVAEGMAQQVMEPEESQRAILCMSGLRVCCSAQWQSIQALEQCNDLAVHRVKRVRFALQILPPHCACCTLTGPSFKCLKASHDLQHCFIG
mmetsp:Transcript_136349/g.271952  ORF Transcript_136349/g.271952 Transcript_136349/m.271952 type:complete len:106 (+) Transcript_136349:1167-1484(+)